jgi:hypothetical protein
MKDLIVADGPQEVREENLLHNMSSSLENNYYNLFRCEV